MARSKSWPSRTARSASSLSRARVGSSLSTPARRKSRSVCSRKRRVSGASASAFDRCQRLVQAAVQGQLGRVRADLLDRQLGRLAQRLVRMHLGQEPRPVAGVRQGQLQAVVRARACRPRCDRPSPPGGCPARSGQWPGRRGCRRGGSRGWSGVMAGLLGGPYKRRPTMFTGLVQDVGTVERVLPGPMTTLWIRTALGAGEFALGESIAVSGACLTVVERDGRHLPGRRRPRDPPPDHPGRAAAPAPG